MSTHRCPGGCGKSVANARYACVMCWWRLPADIRASIVETMRLPLLDPARRAALERAHEWYAANRPDTPQAGV